MPELTAGMSHGWMSEAHSVRNLLFLKIVKLKFDLFKNANSRISFCKSFEILISTK